MKRLLTVIVMVSIILTSFNSAFAENASQSNGIAIIINGEKLDLPVPPIVKHGRTLVPLRAVFEKLNAKVKWFPISASIKITNADELISMRINSNRAYINGNLKNLDVVPVIVKGSTMVPIRFIAEALNAKIDWNPENGSVNIYTSRMPPDTSRGDEVRSYKVVIDAGHGGRETGAAYYGEYEKDLNLDIAKILNDKLKAEGIKTYMTRTDDSTLGLYERSELANGVDADLLVSVHNNAGNLRDQGTMTLYYPGGALNAKGNLTAREFAGIVQDELTGTLGSRNRGVIARPFLAVLRVANMPAVIAEVGYISNREELSRLNSQDYKEKAAEALKNAVLKSLKKM